VDEITIFLITEGLTLVIASAVALFIGRHLRNVLTDLTGTPERAAFWSAFTSLLLILIPLIVVMFVPHQSASGQMVFFCVIDQLKWSLSALVATLLSCAFVIIWFVWINPFPYPRQRDGP
jgi:hypothetical protein